MEYKKIIQMNLFIKQNGLTDIENKLKVTKKQREWGRINEECGLKGTHYCT